MHRLVVGLSVWLLAGRTAACEEHERQVRVEQRSVLERALFAGLAPVRQRLRYCLSLVWERPGLALLLVELVMWQVLTRVLVPELVFVLVLVLGRASELSVWQEGLRIVCSTGRLAYWMAVPCDLAGLQELTLALPVQAACQQVGQQLPMQALGRGLA